MADYDAIVVLGAALTPEGHPSAMLRRRVEAGIAAWAHGDAPLLVMSGGPARHPRPEADAMAELARAAGVPEPALLLERISTRTLENAREVRRIAEREGWQRLLIVTDTLHLPRALFTFRRLGMRVHGRVAGGLVADAGLRVAALLALREMAAFIIYIAILARKDSRT